MSGYGNGKAYLGVKPCGCATFALVAGVDSRRTEERELAKVIASGRSIEVVPVEEARSRLTFDCTHGPPRPADAKAAAAAAVATCRDEQQVLAVDTAASGGDRG